MKITVTFTQISDRPVTFKTGRTAYICNGTFPDKDSLYGSIRVRAFSQDKPKFKAGDTVDNCTLLDYKHREGEAFVRLP